LVSFTIVFIIRTIIILFLIIMTILHLIMPHPSFRCERLEERNAFLVFSTFLSSPLTLGVGLGWV
jgi:hypothetical protein